MTTNKDFLMQPLSDEELADVTGGAGRNPSECRAICGQYEEEAPSVFARCMIQCTQGKNMGAWE